MAIGGFIIGSVAGQFAGSWAYWRALGGRPSATRSEWVAATVAGLVATVVASVIYIPLGVQSWLLGEGASWGVSVFLAVCMGLCQGVLFRGRPLRRPPATPPS